MANILELLSGNFSSVHFHAFLFRKHARVRNSPIMMMPASWLDNVIFVYRAVAVNKARNARSNPRSIPKLH